MIGILLTTTGVMIRFIPDSMVGDIQVSMEDIMDSVGASAGAGVDMDGDVDMAGAEDMVMAGVAEVIMATVADTTEGGMATIMDFITNL